MPKSIRKRLATAVVAVALATAGCGGNPDPDATPSSSPTMEGVLPADYVGIVEPSYGLSLRDVGLAGVTELDSTAYLAGPHFAVRYAQVAAITEISPSQRSALGLAGRAGEQLGLPDDDVPMRAGDGREFLVVLPHDGTALTPHVGPGEDAEPWSAALRIGGAVRPLEYWGERMMLIVNVERNASVALEVTDAGRTQSIDLRTGVTDPVIALYHPPVGSSARCKDTMRITGVSDPVVLNLAMAVALRGYRPGQGWAAPGRAWLEISVSATMTGRGLAGVTADIDVDQSLALRLDDGTRLTTPSALVRVDQYRQGTTDTVSSRFEADAVLSFDVPDTVRAATVTCRTNGTAFVGGNTASWRSYGGSISDDFTLMPPLLDR